MFQGDVQMQPVSRPGLRLVDSPACCRQALETRWTKIRLFSSKRQIMALKGIETPGACRIQVIVASRTAEQEQSFTISRHIDIPRNGKPGESTAKGR
jgi:hypothetical protein